MVEFFKTVDGRITEVSEFTEGCWVNMVHPSSDELEQIAQAAQVEEEFVRAALDPEESSRVDTEDEQLLMIVDIPMVEKSSVEDGGQMFTTIPMGIVVAQNAVITCLEEHHPALHRGRRGKGRAYLTQDALCVPDSAPHSGPVPEKPAYDRARLYPHREASVRLPQK
ncbi:MAG: CorA family divalent cation transporter [Butyricicoccus sp.]